MEERPATPAAGAPLHIDKYEVVERIGRGGFGDVFLGRDTVIHRPVAIKLCNSPDRALVRRFEREVAIVGRLRHPNITILHDSGSYGGAPYLVQEYLPGEDLERQIRLRRPTPPVRRLDCLIQVARGLEHAHRQGVVHRDVKPSNVRVLEDGTVKIMDFGVARWAGATRLTQSGMRVGTMCYMSPEQLRGEEVDQRSDVFAFGVVAFELLTHRHPFPAEGGHALLYQMLEADPLELLSLWPECPKRLSDCVHRCLEKKAGDRFASMSEVLAELEAIEASGDMSRARVETRYTVVRGTGGAVRRRPTRAVRRRRLLRAAAGVAAAALTAAVYFLVPPPQRVEKVTVPPPVVEREPVPEPPAVDPPPSEEPVEAEPAIVERVEAPPPARPAAATPRIVRDAPPEEPRDVELPAADPPAEEVAEAEEETEPPPPIVASAEPEAEPAPPPVPQGQLVINALPWAMVTRVVSDSGKTYTPNSDSRYTPLSVELPVGGYTVTLTHPTEGERPCRLEVTEDGSAFCQELFVKIDARDFFRSAQLDALVPTSMPAGGQGGGGRGGGQGGGGRGGGQGGGPGGGGTPPGGAPPPRGGGGGGLQGGGFSADMGFESSGFGELAPPPVRSRSMPKWIRKAAQAFFDGRYDEVEQEMKSKTARSREELFFARLFLGAALHARFLTAEEADSELARAAVFHLRECRRMFPLFVPHPDYFSPRFIELYSVYAAPDDWNGVTERRTS